jgi:multisubunit Na+/H+ antiporter MnhF subunit
VVRAKERILMSRTKETRSLIVNALFLSGFMVIYSLSGVFQSSPTSFLFVLFIIGSFGSGNATRWLEKERLWLVKTSPINLNRYVREVFRARVTPLLLVLAPVAAAVGAPLLLEKANEPGSLLAVGLSLPSALEIASLMMAGGMYFAAKYGQSSNDETMTSQGQDLANVKRFLYQTVINLGLVAPLMGLVLGSSEILGLTGDSSILLVGTVLGVLGFVYSIGILRFILGEAGRSLETREDL